MEMNFDLSEIDFTEIGIWPWPLKVILLSVLAVIVAAAGYFLVISGQIQGLEKTKKDHMELRKDFEKKTAQAVQLPAYVLQLEEVQKSLGDMLNQLPNSTEVPNLLEDISNAGKASGLEFKLFKPSAENQLDFYVELPIEIVVQGDYHQFANFVSKIAAMPRIVTLHDLKITYPKDDKASQPAKSQNSLGNAANKTRGELLEMQITAKTYRYQEQGVA